MIKKGGWFISFEPICPLTSFWHGKQIEIAFGWVKEYGGDDYRHLTTRIWFEYSWGYEY